MSRQSTEWHSEYRVIGNNGYSLLQQRHSSPALACETRPFQIDQHSFKPGTTTTTYMYIVTSRHSP